MADNLGIALFTDYTAADVTAISDRRRGYVADREYWLAKQRGAGRTDRVLARFCSDQAAEFGQRERAATWAISYIEGRAPAYGNDRLRLPSAEMMSLCHAEFNEVPHNG